MKPSITRARSAILGVAVAGALLVGLTACDPLPGPLPGGTAADCSDVAWGSGSKDASRMSGSPIVGVRAGQHHCFDRLVIDLKSDPGAGWHVRYHAIEQPATGTVVPVTGTALEVIALAPNHTTAGIETFDPANPNQVVDVTGFKTFRQVVFAGTFEGQSTLGIGVRARLPFRAFAMEGSSGTKIVVDVAHSWA